MRKIVVFFLILSLVLSTSSVPLFNNKYEVQTTPQKYGNYGVSIVNISAPLLLGFATNSTWDDLYMLSNLTIITTLGGNEGSIGYLSLLLNVTEMERMSGFEINELYIGGNITKGLIWEYLNISFVEWPVMREITYWNGTHNVTEQVEDVVMLKVGNITVLYHHSIREAKFSPVPFQTNNENNTEAHNNETLEQQQEVPGWVIIGQQVMVAVISVIIIAAIVISLKRKRRK